MKAYQIVDADFVKREIGRMPIVDVRPPLRYDTAHIPSAINIRLDVAAASEDPAEELAEMFQDNGIFPEDAVIVYCQMGVHAKIACDYLASAGYSRLYLYAGSMNDWMRDPARPVEASSVAFAKASEGECEDLRPSVRRCRCRCVRRDETMTRVVCPWQAALRCPTIGGRHRRGRPAFAKTGGCHDHGREAHRRGEVLAAR